MNDECGLVRRLYHRYAAATAVAALALALGQAGNSAAAGNLLGPGALAVMGLVSPVCALYTMTGALCGIGGSTLAASLIGEDRQRESRQVFTAALALPLLLGACLSALVLALRGEIVSLLGAGGALAGAARRYTGAVALAGPFMGAVYPVFHFLRLDGKNAAACFVFLLMAALNIALDLILLGACGMGVEATALASGAAAAAACAVGGAMLLGGDSDGGNFRPVPPDGARHAAALGARIAAAGSPAALESLASLVRTAALNRLLLVRFGEPALGAFSLLGPLSAFAGALLCGAASCLSPLAGVFGAEQDTRSISQTLRLAAAEGMAAVLPLTAAFALFPGQTAGLFGLHGTQALAYAVPAVALYGLSLPPALLCSLLISLYTGTGRIALANMMTLLEELVFVLVPAWLLGSGARALGVWAAFPAAEALTLIAALAMAAGIRRKNRALSPVTLLNETALREGKYLSFSVENDERAVVECAARASAFCGDNSLSPLRTMAISLSLEEMLLSIRAHSLRGKSREMNVRILVLPGEVLLRIRSDGKPFNPLAHYERMRAQSARDRLEEMDALGDSLGIKMILDLAVRVDYKRTFGMNNLTLTL